MTKFSLTIESEESSDIAYGAELVDLFINGDAAKIQPFEVKLLVDLFIDQLGEYIWWHRDWDEEDARILLNTLDAMIKFGSDCRQFAPWDGSVER